MVGPRCSHLCLPSSFCLQTATCFVFSPCHHHNPSSPRESPLSAVFSLSAIPAHCPSHRLHRPESIHVVRLPCAFGEAPSVSFAWPRARPMDDDRESSPASSVDFYSSDRKDNTPPPAEAQQTVPQPKRKAHDVAPTLEKKPRLDSPSPSPCLLNPCAGLPPAIWQHIFLYCSLFDLGRLLQVNRSFHSYLVDVHHVSYSDPIHGSPRLIKSESIWASARNALPIKPPKPLPAFSELRMWQLALSIRCQFCRKKGSEVSGEKPWQKGPGANGVRTIWPFGIRACGNCLKENCQTVSWSSN